MKTTLVILLMTIVTFSGCIHEPSGGGVGWQYLGLINQLTHVCIDGVYSSRVLTDSGTVTVHGKLELNRKVGLHHTWVNTEKNLLRIRSRDTYYEYSLTGDKR